MNILICSDDGPNALGLEILRRTTRQRYKEAKITTMTTSKSMTGQGMAISTTRDARDIEPEKLEHDYYTLAARPVDMIYHAFCASDRYLPTKSTWDVVLVGVNHGHNVGIDVYHSGTVGIAMIASHGFGCSAHAFGQTMESTEPRSHEEDKKDFLAAEKYLPDYFRQTSFEPGECWNTNFPATPDATGYKDVPVAHYSRWRSLPTEVVPRARNESSDITELKRGFITTSQLVLRVNPVLKY